MFKVYGEVGLQRLLLYPIGEPEMKNPLKLLFQEPQFSLSWNLITLYF